MSNFEGSPYAPKPINRTDRFKTSDIKDPTAKFNLFLKSHIQEFISDYSPLKEPINYKAELKEKSIDIKKPLNQRTISQDKINLLNEIRTKTATQLMAEGKVKYLIERSILEGYNQKENLEKIIHEFSKLYGFSLQTQESLNQMIQIYFINKPRVDDFFKHYQNDPQQIFPALFNLKIQDFGFESNGDPKINIYQGPAGVEVFCDNETLNKVISKMYNINEEIMGFAGSSLVQVGQLKYPIFYNFNTRHEPEVYFHELGHNWNKMFKYLNQVQIQADADSFLDRSFYKMSQNKNIEKDIFEFLVNSVHPQLQKFGDELLAKLKSQSSFDDFFDFEDPKNSYDYLKDFRESTTNSIDVYNDEYYCRQIGSLHFLRRNTPFVKNISDKSLEYFEFNREQMNRLKRRVFDEYYLNLTKDITSKIEKIISEKPNIRNNLIGLLGTYPDVEIWPTLLDKLISDL